MHPVAARREFAAELSALVRGLPDSKRRLEPPELKVILSLREDHLADLEELTSELPAILRNRFRLGPLNRNGAREAIVGPAMLEDDAFDTEPFSYREEAIDKIIEFLGKERYGDELKETDKVEPVQLQLICQSLEELVRSGQASRNGHAEISEQHLGGEEQMKQVMSNFYDRVIQRVPASERKPVMKLCETRLISPRGRRLMMEEQVIEHELGIPATRLQGLVNERLLRAQPHLGSTHYELSPRPARRAHPQDGSGARRQEKAHPGATAFRGPHRSSHRTGGRHPLCLAPARSETHRRVPPLATQ